MYLSLSTAGQICEDSGLRIKHARNKLDQNSACAWVPDNNADSMSSEKKLSTSGTSRNRDVFSFDFHICDISKDNYGVKSVKMTAL